MELPWNPVRLEQRIGRVDRLGQTRRVHAIHLVHGDSVEQRVLARLHQRRTRAAADLAAIGPDERAAAAAIFEDAPLGCDHPALTAAATPPLDVARTTAFRRAALQRSGRTDRPFPIRARCARARRIKLAHAVLLLFEQELHAADGRLIARELLPLLVRLRKPVFLQRSDSVPLVRALLSDRLVRRTLATTSLKRAAAIARELVLVRHTLERRLTTIVDLLRPEQTRLFQSSLFDKRAEQSARANAASRALLIDHANRRLAAARDLPSLAPSSSRLVAAWPWQRE
jgi:hypothetical protein